jgi:hypothetical protein
LPKTPRAPGVIRRRGWGHARCSSVGGRRWPTSDAVGEPALLGPAPAPYQHSRLSHLTAWIAVRLSQPTSISRSLTPRTSPWTAAHARVSSSKW